LPKQARALPALAALVVGASACAPARPAVPPAPTPAAAGLAASIAAIIDAPPLHRTSWGILVVDAASGAVLYDRNARRNFIPASNMKLVVSAVSLARLGPDYRYRTELLARMRSADSAATLLAVGSGDPTWSARFHDTALVPFDSMAARVARAGIRQVGELVIDASRFTDQQVHPTWEVSDLPGVFAPPVAAFAAAEGTFRLALTAGPAVGAPAMARVVPPFLQPISATVTTDTAGARAAASTDYTARRDTIYLTARVGLGAHDTLTLAVTRPAETAAVLLADALARHGIAVGSLRVARTPEHAAAAREGADVVAAFESPPLLDIVRGILRPSQNWMAEQLLKTLGAEFAGDGSWRGGHEVQLAYLFDTVGIDSGAVNLRDASGMSPQNLLSPEATVALLAHARARPWGAAYRDALPQPGMAGSTLSARLQGLEGRVHAKTGTISNVNSLSGYLVTADGREVVFSVLSNGSGLPAAVVRGAMDSVVFAIARNVGGG
jgi:serine-type D-Ala-D-Ala carboxypeptidase/endopeptidase (penicillin-binding protein 4)